MLARRSEVRWIVVVVVAGAVLVGCADQHRDHGSEVPHSAGEALDCAGPPYAAGGGNYDTGPETVQDDPRAAVDEWLREQGYMLPDVTYEEAARQADEALFTWTSSAQVLAAMVVRDGIEGPDEQGWGVATYAVCDPSAWPPEVSDALGIQVWTDAEGRRVLTSLVESFPGPEHCDWQEMTYLFLGEGGRDGEYYGTPDPELQELLTVPYAAHVGLPADARDTGYQRDGRELWLAADGSAAYLVSPDGDAERWPAPSGQPIRCD